jgi:ribonuclease HI
VNAALFKSAKRMGVGIMIQNHNGKCVSTCSELIQDVTTPELAEALAIRRAMTLAREEGYDKIILSTDCLSMVHRINSFTLDRSFQGVVIQDIKKEAEMFNS